MLSRYRGLLWRDQHGQAAPQAVKDDGAHPPRASRAANNIGAERFVNLLTVRRHGDCVRRPVIVFFYAPLRVRYCEGGR